MRRGEGNEIGQMEWEFPMTLKEGWTDRQRNRMEIPGSVCAGRVNINLCCNVEVSVSPHKELSLLFFVI